MRILNENELATVSGAQYKDEVSFTSILYYTAAVGLLGPAVFNGGVLAWGVAGFAFGALNLAAQMADVCFLPNIQEMVCQAPASLFKHNSVAELPAIAS